jgi:hypothetical protein
MARVATPTVSVRTADFLRVRARSAATAADTAGRHPVVGTARTVGTAGAAGHHQVEAATGAMMAATVGRHRVEAAMAATPPEATGLMRAYRRCVRSIAHAVFHLDRLSPPRRQ